MATTHYVLSERDRELMQRTIDEVRRLYFNARVPGYSYDDVDYQTPEVLVVLTPPEGIARASVTASTGTGSPSLEDNSVPSAECTVFGPEDVTDTEATLAETDRTLTVYNISTDTDVPGDKWILAVKEKYGYWIAVSGFGGSEAIDDPGTGTGTGITGGYCDLAAIRRTDCITVSTDQGSYRLTYSDGAWTSDELYDYVAGSGPFRFWYAAGAVHLSLNDMELQNCLNGCFTGGPLTGHGVQQEGGTGTGTGTGEYPVNFCEGETFTACVECSCCLDAGYYCVVLDPETGCEAAYLEAADACDLAADICSGPYASEAEALVDCPVIGPGTGSTGGSVLTNCCPGVDVPDILYMHFTVPSGTYACANGATVPIYYNYSSGRWESTPIPWCSGGTATFDIYCSGFAWLLDLDINGTCVATGFAPDAFGCDAIGDSVTMDFVFTDACFTGTLTINVTINP